MKQQREVFFFGTTSSGKSTLANALIGADLLPHAVQEMTAGLTRVSHSRRKSLNIAETDGACWECGSFDFRSPEQIGGRLREVMEIYHSRGDLAPPRFEINWPTRIGSRIKRRDLAISLVDTPGVRWVGDDRHSHGRTEGAVSVVVFGADETDERKQFDSLNLAMSLSDNPTNIIYVLNKVDIFLNDREPNASARQLEDRLRRMIARAESERGFTSALNRQIYKVSGRIGLLASVIEEYGGYKSWFARIKAKYFQRDAKSIEAKALEELTKYHRHLLDSEFLEDLPRATSKWTLAQRKLLVKVALQESMIDPLAKVILDTLTLLEHPFQNPRELVA
ncbi:hypothetical protein FRD01_22585 [Microvenator marinus]|uniref:Dynamin N-terminal domain-containing protein n=1 Tax=Microvenator marinus TaxID=2600177 RepID=A0A5B8XWN9_9DELT|nr:dynamin family protein [Microvenator marinus]QED29970.1 hypothetical protein FRD01_22585 [Microvenator marinus]